MLVVQVADGAPGRTDDRRAPVAFSAYLAAVLLAADAERHGEPELVEAFRHRALASGAVAGGLAIAGLFVIHSDAPRLYTGLLHGGALATVIVSVLSGLVIFGLVWTRRFELARYGVAVPTRPPSPAGRWPAIRPCCRGWVSTRQLPRATR